MYRPRLAGPVRCPRFAIAERKTYKLTLPKDILQNNFWLHTKPRSMDWVCSLSHLWERVGVRTMRAAPTLTPVLSRPAGEGARQATAFLDG